MARAPQLMLGVASFLMALGGAMHAAAFNRAAVAIAGSNLPRFFGDCSKALWLADSTTMFSLAALFGLIAAKPSAATRPVVMLLALIPAATGVLIYVFLGSFFAGHILMATAILVFFAGVQLSGGRLEKPTHS